MKLVKKQREEARSQVSGVSCQLSAAKNQKSGIVHCVTFGVIVGGGDPCMLSSRRTVSRIVSPATCRLFGLSLSIVSCGVCQKALPYPYSRSMISATGTPL